MLGQRAGLLAKKREQRVGGELRARKPWVGEKPAEKKRDREAIPVLLRVGALECLKVHQRQSVAES